MKSIDIQRIYDHKKADGTYRILVDKLWPRGIKKVDLEFDEWNKELAPSTELRKQFNHKPELFGEFTKNYQKELSLKEDELQRIRDIAEKQPVNLLYGAKDTQNNHAVVLRHVLLKK